MPTHSVGLRLLAILAVVVVSVWAIYPPAEKIKLGLDLKGGVHLVLRVQTDDALRRETQLAAERLRDELTRRGARFARVDATGPTELVAAGVDDDSALRDAVVSLDAAFEMSGRGGTYTFAMKPNVAEQLRDETVRQAIETIDRRVNALGIAEAQVGRYSLGDQILVQLPGVADVAQARRVIQTTAQLRMTLIEDGPFPTPDAALLRYGGSLPPGLEILSGDSEDDAAAVYYVVDTRAPVSGRDLRSAQQSLDEFNRPAVAFTLTEEAARRFGEFTARHINRRLATVLDDRVTSVATITSRITDRGQIVGLTREEMIDQVITLKSGALPAGLDYLHQTTVSATLGEASIRSGVLACAGGLAFVALFMLTYYKLAGLNALVSIALNLLTLLALMTYLGGALTLPGIAGLLLTIGMGVDSNVLIFERIKEELASSSRGARAAVRAAFDRVWVTIVDTHVASLLAAAFLFQFGPATIRGFATTLTLGLLANVFTAVFVSRTLFELTLARRGRDAPRLSI